MAVLRKTLQVALYFAGVGFVLPWLLLTYYGIAHHLGGHPNTAPLLFLCPSSIMALGLDQASLLVGILGWLMISFSNAVLYAVPGVGFGIVVGLRNRR